MTEIYFPFSISMLSCLLGFLIAWIIQNFNIRKLNKAMVQKHNRIKGLEIICEDLKEKLAFTSQQANGLKEFTYEQSYKLERLEADNKRYFEQLSELNSIPLIEEDDYNDQQFDVSDVLSRIKNRKHEIPFQRIGFATEFEKDDLKRLKGIGHFIERKLNALGIFTFKQIAALTENDISLVNQAIEFFPGQIMKDQWVMQASNMLSPVTK